MRSGSPALFEVALFDASGAGVSYADKAAFEAAGWSMSFIDMSTGAAVSPTLSYTIAAVSGVTGRHVVALTLTTAAWLARITPPTAAWTFMALPSAAWTGEQYDTDSLYARINSVYGVTSATSVPSATLSDLIEGDSYSATIAVPTAYLLQRTGWSGLTGATLHGTIRRPSDDGTGTAAATLSASTPFVVINGTDATAFDIYWTTYPTGMVLTSPERTTGSVVFRVEVQATKAGKTVTILYNAPLTVYRQDDAT